MPLKILSLAHAGREPVSPGEKIEKAVHDLAKKIKVSFNVRGNVEVKSERVCGLAQK